MSAGERDSMDAKLETLVPGNVVEFDPGEADRLGAFPEDALTEDDALDSVYDESVMEG